MFETAVLSKSKATAAYMKEADGNLLAPVKEMTEGEARDLVRRGGCALRAGRGIHPKLHPTRQGTSYG